MPSPVFPPLGPDWKAWARQFTAAIQRQAAKLYTKTSDDNPSENGVILWDEQNKYPVVSSSNAFLEVLVKVSVPASSVGAAGDKSGMISFDANYIYVCTASHDGSANIWKRAALTGGSW